MNKREFLKTGAILGLGAAVSPIVRAMARPLTGARPPFIQAPLPYAFEALEPFVDAQTMQIHYEKHHAGYVKNLNEALEGSSLKGMVIEDILISVEATPAFNKIRNNAGGHYNHTLFWTLMAPGGGKPMQPEGPLMRAIVQHFGSVENLEKQFKDAAKGVFGSGWAWLCAGPGRALFISQTSNQDNPIMRNIADRGGVPLLAIDVWEHAYYLKHQNRRADYIDAFWQIIDWEEVERRYSAV